MSATKVRRIAFRPLDPARRDFDYRHTRFVLRRPWVRAYLMRASETGSPAIRTKSGRCDRHY
jgi:hypothetical protein